VRRLPAAALLVAALSFGICAEDASAHAGLVSSDPAAGAELGAAPSAVELTFSEQPEPSLTEIEVLDEDGTPVQSGQPSSAGDPLTLGVPVPRLGRGVYTVDYRSVSAVDGHATSGTFAFGVRESPGGVATAVTSTTTSDTAALEVVARWLLLLGLVVLLGAAVAGAAAFGGRDGTDLRLAVGGWLVAIAGLVLLAVAQRRTAGSSLGDLFDTPVGDALIWRAVGLAVTGAALLYAARRAEHRREALGVAALGALEVIVFHVDAGHAAAGSWAAGLTVTMQVAHFVAAGVWFGGLAALLLGVRGAPSEDKAAAVRRFSAIAVVALVLVLVTGAIRAVDELGSWGELFDTGYGRAVLAKIVLIALIFALAARNRRRSVPAAASDLGPLRRTSRIELALALGALVAAALLGSLAPPVAGQADAASGLSVSGSDFGTTVAVELTTASDEPGPNRFVVNVDDYDTGEPAEARQVSLRFIPLDDPAEPPTTLTLRGAADGGWTGSGSNLRFDGRWRITVLIERAADSVAVPLELDVPGPAPQLSAVLIPGRAPVYDLFVYYGDIRVSPHPLADGPSDVYVSAFNAIDVPQSIDGIVVTGAAGDGPVEQKPVRRLTRSRFVAEVDLEPGPYTIGVVAQTPEGNRMTAEVTIDVPE
jgi:copper transport protein